MYRTAYQRGMLTVFFSCGSKPLALWDVHIKNGYVSKFMDQEIKSTVLEIGGTNVSTTYMICPKGNQVLGISMPFLVMIVKNLKKYFTFEVTVLDETSTRRRFRVSNFQSSTQILPLCTVMPIGLSEGWNQIQFNLSDFMQRAYKKQFVEVQKLKINANIRLRRIYFADRLLAEEELPPEYKLFFPLGRNMGRVQKVADKEKPVEGIEKVSSTQEITKQTSVVAVPSKKLSVKSMSHIALAKIKSEQLPHIKEATSVLKVVEQVEMGIDATEEVIKSETEELVPKEEALHSEPGEILEPDSDIVADIVPTSSDANVDKSEAITETPIYDDALDHPDLANIREDTEILDAGEKPEATELLDAGKEPEATELLDAGKEPEATELRDVGNEPEDLEATGAFKTEQEEEATGTEP